MAQEYFYRTLTTSQSNGKIGSLSVWVKRNERTTTPYFSAGYNNSGTDQKQIDLVHNSAGHIQWEEYGNDSGAGITNYYHRQLELDYDDVNAWRHICVTWNTHHATSSERCHLYINGKRVDTAGQSNDFAQDYVYPFLKGASIHLGKGNGSVQYGSTYLAGSMMDMYFVDGIELGPDTFCYAKQGDGSYTMGDGDTVTQFPGQWRPKSPSVVKNEINSKGGFGAIGFYLPMKGSANPGADFSVPANSILEINDHLTQPDAGLRSSTLKEDSLYEYLKLAVPLNGNLTDYSSSNHTLTNNGATSSTTCVYYGSAYQFDGATPDYINITDDDSTFYFSSDYTIEAWVRPSSLDSNYHSFISQWGSNNDRNFEFDLRGDAGNVFRFYQNFNGTTRSITSETVAQDDQWYHLAFVREGNTGRLFVNGVCEAINNSWSGTPNNSSTTVTIGGYGATPSAGAGAWYGWIQDLRIYNGVAKYSTGFKVGNHFNSSGHSNWQAIADTPVNNFATLNEYFATPVIVGAYSDVTEGGLTSSCAANPDDNKEIFSAFGASSGKYYYEVRTNDTGNKSDGIGWYNSNNYYSVIFRDTGDGFLGNAIISGQRSDPAWGATSWQTAGDIVATAIDLDNNTIDFYVNGVLQSSAAQTSIYDGVWVPHLYNRIDGSLTANFGQNPSFGGRESPATTHTDANGRGEFYYKPPAGYLALCSQNLPAPIRNPRDHFDTVTFTGNDETFREISGLNFFPGFVWLKDRSRAERHMLANVVQGPGKVNTSYDNRAEESRTDVITQLTDGGFVIGSAGPANFAGDDFVAWCWKLGGNPVTNSEGSASSLVSANTEAGISVMKYTGTGTSNTTLGHGLNQAPEIIFTKGLTTAYNWNVSTVYKPNGYIELNTQSVFNSNSDRYITPGTTTNSLTSYVQFNDLNDDHIAYCFHSVPGFSQIGLYTGNGSFNGPYVPLGFKPAWVMIKAVDNAADWVMFDNKRSGSNPNRTLLYANQDTAEQDGIDTRDPDLNIQFHSTGFKVLSTNNDANVSQEKFLYMAFAESPLKYAGSK